jgi:hypothetical protein
MLNRDYIVYGLYDPDTYQLKYVGQTIHFVSRMQSHKTTSGASGKLKAWSRKLKEQGKEPLYSIIDKASSLASLDRKELKYIRHFKKLYPDHKSQFRSAHNYSPPQTDKHLLLPV